MQISFEELYSGQMLCYLLDQPWWCHLLDQPWWKMQRFLIYPLELLRPDAANTLLKSLEEPPANTIFILLADRVEANQTV